MSAFQVGLESRRAVSGFDVRLYAHPPSHRLPWHVHEAPVLVLVHRGGYLQHGPGRSFECHAGEVAVVPAGESTHEVVGPRGARSVLVFLSSERASHVEGCTNLLTRLEHLRGAFGPPLADSLARELAARDGCAPLALEAGVLELLSTAARTRESMGRGAPPRWLADACALLHDRHGDPLSLEQIADEVGISRSQLARGFRAWLRTSPGQYLRRVRLERAAERLRISTEPIATIAVSFGFYDQSHLSNAFRRAYGVTPAKYRGQHR